MLSKHSKFNSRVLALALLAACAAARPARAADACIRYVYVDKKTDQDAILMGCSVVKPDGYADSCQEVARVSKGLLAKAQEKAKAEVKSYLYGLFVGTSCRAVIALGPSALPGPGKMVVNSAQEVGNAVEKFRTSQAVKDHDSSGTREVGTLPKSGSGDTFESLSKQSCNGAALLAGAKSDGEKASYAKGFHDALTFTALPVVANPAIAADMEYIESLPKAERTKMLEKFVANVKAAQAQQEKMLEVAGNNASRAIAWIWSGNALPFGTSNKAGDPAGFQKCLVNDQSFNWAMNQVCLFAKTFEEMDTHKLDELYLATVQKLEAEVKDSNWVRENCSRGGDTSKTPKDLSKAVSPGSGSP